MIIAIFCSENIFNGFRFSFNYHNDSVTEYLHTKTHNINAFNKNNGIDIFIKCYKLNINTTI